MELMHIDWVNKKNGECDFQQISHLHIYFLLMSDLWWRIQKMNFSFEGNFCSIKWVNAFDFCISIRKQTSHAQKWRQHSIEKMGLWFRIVHKLYNDWAKVYVIYGFVCVFSSLHCRVKHIFEIIWEN